MPVKFLCTSGFASRSSVEILLEPSHLTLTFAFFFFLRWFPCLLLLLEAGNHNDEFDEAMNEVY